VHPPRIEDALERRQDRLALLVVYALVMKKGAEILAARP
jgi:hypothetical protein